MKDKEEKIVERFKQNYKTYELVETTLIGDEAGFARCGRALERMLEDTLLWADIHGCDIHQAYDQLMERI